MRLYLLGAVGLAVSAFYGGGYLIADPTGATIGLSMDWLAGSPFPDYLVPGLVLVVGFGLGSLAVILGLLVGHRWTPYAAPGLGFGLLTWIVVQIWVVGTVTVLHIVYGGLGLLLVGLSIRCTDRSGPGT